MRRPSERASSINVARPPDFNVHRAPVGASVPERFEVATRFAHHEVTVKESSAVRP